MYDSNYVIKAETQTKKRVRASQACVHCRKKKIKCDESRPSCAQCRESNIICEYTEPRKRGPRKGYVQLLEERLAQMEKKLMGPGGMQAATTTHVLSDEENHSLSSASIHAASPIQLYENPDNTADLPPLDIVNHLVDLFFTYVNSVFPFVVRPVLKRSIQDGSVSRPLLYSVLAISARFSERPSIRTNPPYLAGEKYAEKAISLVSAETLLPTMANIQFWGIMSCLEYGRASGSTSWIYGGLAVRFCQELGYYKEETMRTPIFAEDGSIDTLSMALRRRVFWSCICIDKLSSAGTHRPQCLDRFDCDTNPPTISDCLALRDPPLHKNIDGRPLTDDSLMNIANHYIKVVEAYGEVNRYMNRAKSNSASVVWPPIAEFRNLDMQLRQWHDQLPETFKFNQKNLDHHHQFASGTYTNLWLCSHAVWCSSMMILHRGSLAFSDVRPSDSVTEDLYRRIQQSIDACRMCVDAAMGIFGAIKDICGFNTLPYMGYSAYVFATVLMTATFSSNPESCKKSSRGLKILYDLIDGLCPYWPMCERLANATKELIVAHGKLYTEKQYENNTIQYHTSDVKASFPSRSAIRSHSSSLSTSPSIPSSPINQASRSEPPHLSALLGVATTDSPLTNFAQPSNRNSYKSNDYYATSLPSYMNTSSPSLYDQQNQPQSSALSSIYSNSNRGNEIDFNSLEFLYDTGLFGQVVFDVDSNNTNGIASTSMGYPQQHQQQQQPLYQSMMQSTSQPFINNTSDLSMNSPSPKVSSAFQPMIPQQQLRSPSTYNPSKSLWN